MAALVRHFSRVLRWVIRIVGAGVSALVLLAVGGAAVATSRLPDLQPWHHLVSTLEPTAAVITAGFTLDDHFQSVVDATVSARAVVTRLFDRLAAGRHELVRFDINRHTGVDAFTTPGAILPRLTGGGPRTYTATIVSNTSPDTFDVSA